MSLFSKANKAPTLADMTSGVISGKASASHTHSITADPSWTAMIAQQESELARMWAANSQRNVVPRPSRYPDDVHRTLPNGGNLLGACPDSGCISEMWFLGCRLFMRKRELYDYYHTRVVGLRRTDEKVYLVVAVGADGAPVSVADDAALFPSDELVNKLQLMAGI